MIYIFADDGKASSVDWKGESKLPHVNIGFIVLNFCSRLICKQMN